MLRDLEVQAHILLLEDLILDLLLVDLLEDLLDIVLGLLEDPFLLGELHLQRLNLHVDLAQLRVSLTYLADDIFCCDLMITGEGLNLFFLGFKTEDLTFVLLHLHAKLLNHLELLGSVFLGNGSRLADASHGSGGIGDIPRHVVICDSWTD